MAFADLMVFGQKTGHRIHFKRGIRQGGSESGTFFVLGIDPVIRWFKARVISPGDILKVYADDFAFSIRSIEKSLIKIMKAFTAVELATGLSLKIPKCQLVLVGNVELE